MLTRRQAFAVVSKIQIDKSRFSAPARHDIGTNGGQMLVDCLGGSLRLIIPIHRRDDEERRHSGLNRRVEVAHTSALTAFCQQDRNVMTMIEHPWAIPYVDWFKPEAK